MRGYLPVVLQGNGNAMSSSPQRKDTRRLSPWSGFSVHDLAGDASRIVGKWAELVAKTGEKERPPTLTDQLAWTLKGIGGWIASDEETIPEDLRAVFRDLAFSYRAQGCRLDQTLLDLERLEEVLVGDQAGAGRDSGDEEMSASRGLRRALRTLWAETVQLNDALTQRRDRERADALERFEEILSHELGNRLGAARTGVDILQNAPPGLSEDRRADLLELVCDGIDAALKTVDDVGAFVQAQRWAEDQAQPFDEVVAGVLEGLAPQARNEGVTLRLEAASLPTTPVDAGRLRLIVSNFLVNGIRYADLDEDDPYVGLYAERSGDTLHIAVSDNGIGIPPEEQSEVFSFHRRGGNHAGRDGSGLGLTIASEATTQLGGRIELESEAGVGTTFRVFLPVGEEGVMVSESTSPPGRAG